MAAKSKKRVRWIIAAAVAAAVAAAAIGGRSGAFPAAETAFPQKGDITRTASAYGRIRAVKQVKISPDVSGEIVAIYYDEGDTVTAGSLLLKIKQESYLLAISRCEAALGSAIASRDAGVAEMKLRQLEYNRLKALYEQDATCLAQLQQADIAYEAAEARARECEYQVSAAKSQLDAARSELSKTLVYSPIDGILTSLRVEPGERVVGTSTMAGTEMMTIADLGRMELVVDIGENDICNIQVGDEAEIKPDASPSSVLKGRVEKIAVCSSSAAGMSATTDFEVRISIDNQDIIKLLPGMSASVLIYTGSKNDILTIPLQAVFVKDGQETVWTVDGQQKVHATAVSCGLQDFGKVEVTGGLSEGDRIVTGPFQLITKTLSEGDKIKIGNGGK
ncbi:MAG: efflux RND transporter periplasmic adaptor subunit [Bacteroidales bacterium]|nr:efflux RND transporter periplasmic adaptor subunit [Bacteroidales bacterium]